MTLPLVLVAENIRSLHNVGSFFRTADGMGVERVYLCGYTGTPPREQIAKVALGAEDTVSWEHHADPLELVKRLKEKKYYIAALEQTKRSVHIESWEPKWPLALIIGHEVDGVSRNLLDLADVHLEIPMSGEKESLNVSVAVGIALATLRSQHLSLR